MKFYVARTGHSVVDAPREFEGSIDQRSAQDGRFAKRGVTTTKWSSSRGIRSSKRYACVSCGPAIDADLNTLLNILKRGLATGPSGNSPGAVASLA